MSTDLGASFNDQFMNINTKLKKRFMRKPNISEATNEFIALGIQCENSEQPAFAGHCYVGAAKCEAMAGNFLGEAEQYHSAARQFMKAEKKLATLKFDSPDRENLEAAIGCFMQALAKYPEKSPLRTGILMELANDLVSLNHKLEALHYYEQAFEMVEDRTRKMMFMRKLMDLQMDCGKYELALETSNKLCDSNFNLPEDMLSETQVSRVLLALLTVPTDENKPPSLKQLFSDLLKEDDDCDSLPFNVELYLKLQSMVAAVGAADVPAMLAVAGELRRLLTRAQCDLLDVLVRDRQSEYLVLG